MIVHTKFEVNGNTLEFEIDTQKIHPILEKNRDDLYQILFAPPLEHPTFDMRQNVLLQDEGTWYWGPYVSPEDYYTSSISVTKEQAAREFIECEVMLGIDSITYTIIPVTIDQLVRRTEDNYREAEVVGKCKIIEQ